MKVYLSIEIPGKIDSRRFYEIVRNLGDINVTDLGDKTLVYGTCSPETASRVFFHAMHQGDITATVITEK